MSFAQTAAAHTRVIDFGEHDQKLVPTVTARGVCSTDTIRQPSRHGLQEFVASGMPESVIDTLEAVQVEQEQHHLLVLTRRLSHRLLEPVQQQPAIGQSGKLVVIGEVAYLRFPSRKLDQLPVKPRIDLRQGLDLLPGGLCLLATACERPRDVYQFGKSALQVRSRDGSGFRIDPPR